jgi:tetratricopeptide (TPR) repeat protein
VAEILARLEADPVELREQVLAAELLQQIDRTLEEMLQRGLVFELPVPRDALAAICESIPNLDWQINRAVALGLLEVSPDSSLRVPRILPVKLPEDAEILHKQAAEVLYRLWWDEKKGSTEEQGLEIHRLALRGKEEEIAANMADVLARNLKSWSRFIEAVHLCELTLEITQDYRVLHELAQSEVYLGAVDKALEHYQQALDCCPPEDEQEKAGIILHLARFYANRGQIEEGLTLCQQSLEIEDRIGNIGGKAAALHQLAGLKMQQGQIEEAITLCQRSLKLKELTGNVRGKAATFHQLAILKTKQGQFAEASLLCQQSLELEESIGNVHGIAATLHELGRIKSNQGQTEEAIALFRQSLEITENVGYVHARAMTMQQLSILVAARGDFVTALGYLKQSLEILQQLKSPDTEITMGILTWMQQLADGWKLHSLAMLKSNEGEIEKAIAIWQESLEIFERIDDEHGKSTTLAMLGQWLAAQGEFDTAIDYLQQSLEILLHLQFPDTEKVRQILNQVQQMAGSQG